MLQLILEVNSPRFDLLLFDFHAYMNAKPYLHLTVVYQVYFSSVLQNKLLNESGVHIICVHPGSIKTNVVCPFTRLDRFCNHLNNLFSNL